MIKNKRNCSLMYDQFEIQKTNGTTVRCMVRLKSQKKANKTTIKCIMANDAFKLRKHIGWNAKKKQS